MGTDKSQNAISFWQLITDHRIEIPIIQRDYAQGRNDSKTQKIRSRFLKNIIDSLHTENNGLELDFVYGNIEKDLLQPLDGQQRLTTLFLLHWFLAATTKNIDPNKETLLKFTYETRISSRDFSNGLVKNWNNLGQGDILSERISDSEWFFLSWEKDPTIKAMLTMLDAIELDLKDKNNVTLSLYWEKLTYGNSPIVFNFKELNHVGLTDDLYIKMNARGKALTEFENFKAQFEKYIKETNPDQSDWERECKKPTEKFSHKIDTIWTDLFWKHRGIDNIIDDEFLKFIAGIAITNYAQNLAVIENKQEDELIRLELEKKSNKKKVSFDAVKRERIERRIQTLYNAPEEITPQDFATKEGFVYLLRCLDKYAQNKNDELYPQDLLLWEYCRIEKVNINPSEQIANTLFIEFIKSNETTYKQRVLFFAQTQFLLKTQTFNPNTFKYWIRVVRNIVENATIDSSSTYIGAIGLINELSSGAENIYEYLKFNKIVSGFAAAQTAEEKLKSSIPDFSNNQNVIFATEDTRFCKGRITFALDCIDVDSNNLERFSSYKLEKIEAVIKKHLNGDDISNDFRRGLFTIDDNQFYDYWSTSYLYAVRAPKRCMIEDIKDLYNFAYNRNFKKYLILLLQKLTTDDLETIISTYEIPNDMPNWKKLIIKEKGLLDFSRQHYFAVKEDKSRCWLIPQSKVANSPEGVKKCKLIE